MKKIQSRFDESSRSLNEKKKPIIDEFSNLWNSLNIKQIKTQYGAQDYIHESVATITNRRIHGSVYIQLAGIN